MEAASSSSFSLLLDEATLSDLPEHKRPIFVHEWLRWLTKTLPGANRVEVREKQKQLVAQLMDMVQRGTQGPTARCLVAKALTTIFAVGDTFSLFDTINK